MKSLKFNHKEFTNDLVKALTAVSDELIEEFYSEAQKYLSREAKASIDVDRANYDDVSKMIRSHVAFRAKALLESFGKGSSMDMGNDYLMDYMESNLWNPLRTGITIVGRPKGEYTDIFGNKRYSEGNLAGIPIENKVRPRKPSYSIQNAEKWFLEENGMVERRISLAIDEFLSNSKKYFVYR